MIVAGVVVLLLTVAAIVAGWLFSGYGGETVYVKIPRGASAEQLRDSLESQLGESYGESVYNLWNFLGGDPAKAHGAYRVTPGDSRQNIARRIKNGLQSPVKLTWSSARTMQDLARRVASQLELTPEEFLQAADSVLTEKGFKKAQMPAAFFPDTYEVYWTAGPGRLIEKLTESCESYWNASRRGKAADLGLTPVEVMTVASIVEEESSKTDEWPKIARLYLNRLKADMPLQADPTVKFAIGDPSIRRITAKMTRTLSPYNTYLNKGLPPGPIRLVSQRSVDAVLNAARGGWLYMCAREDFSGYHNFAADYATHQANASRYQAELNRRNIR